MDRALYPWTFFFIEMKLNQMSMTVFVAKTEWLEFHFKLEGLANCFFSLKFKAFIEKKFCTLSSDAAPKIIEIARTNW